MCGGGGGSWICLLFTSSLCVWRGGGGVMDMFAIHLQSVCVEGGGGGHGYVCYSPPVCVCGGGGGGHGYVCYSPPVCVCGGGGMDMLVPILTNTTHTIRWSLGNK